MTDVHTDVDATQLRGLLADQLRLSRRLRARVRELEAGRTASLAIVGMAMRFPGAVSTPEQYWEFLTGPGDAIGDIPADRPGLGAVYHPEVGQPGRSYVNRAGFLRGVADFDADFFGISQREAQSLDPQQRLLLETSWEALERAGIAARRGDRLDAGVFVGLMAAEYVDRLASGDLERLDPYYGTGGGHCFAAGRISYTLGLRGPAVSIDTACSSSLVALHAAAGSLRAGECRYALVGGANLVFSPQLMVSLCASRALAPDGRCKPFTAAADGYGRGEGVATLVLMRLADAVAEDRPVLAVLRGSAVNHDGASAGLTVPNGPAQQEVIRAALRDAGVSPDQVSYVEAHGTGTALGDPIEAAALDAVYGADRTGADRLLVSSVKARLGHLEAASGLAGLLKLVLMLGYGQIPADVDPASGPLSPIIPWADNRLEVPRQARPWPGGTRLAGISAFGLSGTNAHAVLQAPDPAPDPAPGPVPRPELLVLSARTAPALQALAAAVSTYLYRCEAADLGSVCHTLRAGRAALACRVAVTGSTPRELAQRLSQAVAPGPAPVPATPPRPVLRTAAPAGPATGAGAGDVLAKPVAALAADLPLLAGHGCAELDPAGWLAGALAALGVPGVPVRTSAAADLEHPAVLAYAGSRVALVPADPDQATAVFLAAIGTLYRAGADLRLAGLRAPGARLLPDLPTYPFQRRRYWIDEPDPRAAAGRPGSPVSGPASPGPAGHAGGAAADQLGGADADAVERFLRAELAAVLRAEDSLDLGRSFAELGGDSFTAMLLVRSAQDRYQVDDVGVDFAADQPLSEVLAGLARTITRLAAQAPGPRRGG